MFEFAINPTLWLTFAGASTLLILMPGPIVTLVVANSLTQGARAGLTNIIGNTTALIIFFTIGGLGMVWVMSLLSDWFNMIRWAGAVYLIYIGIKAWMAKSHGLEEHLKTRTTKKQSRAFFLQGFVVGITNPKMIIFYAAFFPQFMDPTLPAAGQLFVLSITFLIIATILDSCYAVLAGKLRPWLTGERRGRIRNRITGTLLIGTGLALALTRKAP
ncbi:MAG: LysE family translocator [Rhodospirillales bacterium]|jgi:homoserine/homoserine lactone efflux protein|nr:LysE family translocator [Rhodospirillales bacterium]